MTTLVAWATFVDMGDSETRTPLAERIKTLSELGGFKGRELDRLAGLAPGHVWMIVKRNNVTLKTLAAIAEATGCTLGWLSNGEGDAPTRDQVLQAKASAEERIRAAADQPDSTPAAE